MAWGGSCLAAPGSIPRKPPPARQPCSTPGGRWVIRERSGGTRLPARSAREKVPGFSPRGDVRRSRLGSANAECRAEPPRREGPRLPAAVRDQPRSAAGVSRGAARRRRLRGSAGKWQVAILAAEQNRPKLRLISRDQRPRVSVPAERPAALSGLVCPEHASDAPGLARLSSPRRLPREAPVNRAFKNLRTATSLYDPGTSSTSSRHINCLAVLACAHSSCCRIVGAEKGRLRDVAGERFGLRASVTSVVKRPAQPGGRARWVKKHAPGTTAVMRRR